MICVKLCDIGNKSLSGNNFPRNDLCKVVLRDYLHIGVPIHDNQGDVTVLKDNIARFFFLFQPTLFYLEANLIRGTSEKHASV